MVTGREISRAEQEIRMLKDREKREKKHEKLIEERHKLQQKHAMRHMGTLERGVKGLPSQVKRDLAAIQKSVTSKSSKRKIGKFTKLLGKIEKQI